MLAAPARTDPIPTAMWNKLPNILTLSRIGVIPLIAGLLFIEPPIGNWVSFGFYVFACVTDFFDGYLARSWHQQSAIGRFLDPIADKLLVAALLLVLAGDGQIQGLAILPAVVILCREILVSGLREYLAEVRIGLPVSKLAKWKTVVQMLALGFLIVGAAGPDFGPLSTSQIGEIGLWISAVLTLATGYDYLRRGIIYIVDEDERRVKAEREAAAAAVKSGNA